MNQTPNINTAKTRARKAAKLSRAAVHGPALGIELIQYAADMLRSAGRAGSDKPTVIGGYWPLPNEIDIRPLMRACHDAGYKLALPCTPPAGNPLTFRAWQPDTPLKAGPYGTREPFGSAPEAAPDIVLAPLLAFNAAGYRLGYGGGFYDRTLAGLRDMGAVFACGIAYAGQETQYIPTDQYDQKLDGILTEQYFRKFT